MSLAELPEWLEWWLISLLLLAWCGIALAVALVIAGAVSLRERAPRPARQESGRGEPTMLAQIDADSALGRALRERAARETAGGSILARVPAQRAPERGRRRVPCAPGEPCGLHHPTICVASACCDRYCPTADPGHAAPATTLQDPTRRIFQAVIDARASIARQGDRMIAVEMSTTTLGDLARSSLATAQGMVKVDRIMGLPIIVNDSLPRGRVVGRPKDPIADRPVIDPGQPS